jgi:hypothetical protein
MSYTWQSFPTGPMLMVEDAEQSLEAAAATRRADSQTNQQRCTGTSQRVPARKYQGLDISSKTYKQPGVLVGNT